MPFSLSSQLFAKCFLPTGTCTTTLVFIPRLLPDNGKTSTAINEFQLPIPDICNDIAFTASFLAKF